MKSVLIDVTFEGVGIVNFDDSSRQMKIMDSLNIPGTVYGDIKNENFKIGKHNYYILPSSEENSDKDKVKYGYKLLVSSDCLRNAIFGNIPSNDIMFNDYIFAKYLTSEQAICRGYTFLLKDVGQNKRSSSLTITDAEQTDMNKAINLMVNTTNGERNETSLRYVENIGKKEYRAEGKIELAKLAFISASTKFDRMAVSPDMVKSEIFDKVLKEHYGDIANVEKGYFLLKEDNLPISCSEFGFLLNKELVDYLTKWILKRILSLEINRAKATFRVKKLKIKFVNNIFTDTRNDDDKWKVLKTPEDIDKLPMICNDDIWVKVNDKDLKDFETEVEAYKKKLEEVKASKGKKKDKEA